MGVFRIPRSVARSHKYEALREACDVLVVRMSIVFLYILNLKHYAKFYTLGPLRIYGYIGG